MSIYIHTHTHSHPLSSVPESGQAFFPSFSWMCIFPILFDQTDFSHDSEFLRGAKSIDETISQTKKVFSRCSRQWWIHFASHEKNTNQFWLVFFDSSTGWYITLTMVNFLPSPNFLIYQWKEKNSLDVITYLWASFFPHVQGERVMISSFWTRFWTHIQFGASVWLINDTCIYNWFNQNNNNNNDNDNKDKDTNFRRCLVKIVLHFVSFWPRPHQLSFYRPSPWSLRLVGRIHFSHHCWAFRFQIHLHHQRPVCVCGYDEWIFREFFLPSKIYRHTCEYVCVCVYVQFLWHTYTYKKDTKLLGRSKHHDHWNKTESERLMTKHRLRCLPMS